MSDKIEIKRIVIKLRDKEINLTVDEAKELQSVLGNMFGAKTTEWVTVPYPYYVPYNPWPYRYDHWYVTYGNGDTAGVVYCASNT